jgi:hypothetical protein
MNTIIEMAGASIYRPDCINIENGAFPRISGGHRQWNVNCIWTFRSNSEELNVIHEKNIRSLAKETIDLLSAKGS